VNTKHPCCGSVLGLRTIPSGSPKETLLIFGRPTLDVQAKRFSNRKGNENMKNKIVRRRACCERGHDCSSEPRRCSRSGRGISQRRSCTQCPGGFHAPMRPGGVSSFRSTPMRSQGSRPFLFQANALPSFGMRSTPSPRVPAALFIRVEVRSRVPVHTR